MGVLNMLFSRKRIFAGKSRLQSEPFCPCLTNASGYQSLLRNSLSFESNLGGASRPRPSVRDGKRRV